MNHKAPQTEVKRHRFFMPKIALAPDENRTVLPERVIGLRASEGAGHYFFKALFFASFKGQICTIPPRHAQGYPHDFNKIAQVIINNAVMFLFFKLRSLHKIHSKNCLKSGNKFLTIKPNGSLVCSAFLFIPTREDLTLFLIIYITTAPFIFALWQWYADHYKDKEVI